MDGKIDFKGTALVLGGSVPWRSGPTGLASCPHPYRHRYMSRSVARRTPGAPGNGGTRSPNRGSSTLRPARSRALHPFRRRHVPPDRGDDRAVRGARAPPPLHRRHVARPVPAAAAGRASRVRGRRDAGAAPRCRADGGGAAQVRHAADQGRRRRRAAQGPGRRARLPRRRPGPARGPQRGDDGGRAGRRGQARRARHRHDRAPVRPAGGAAGDRHLALLGAEHVEPHDRQSAVVESGLRGGRGRVRAARGQRRRAGGLPAGRRGVAEHGHGAGLRPCRRRPCARHARLGGGPRRAAQGLPGAHLARPPAGAPAPATARAPGQGGCGTPPRAAGPAQRAQACGAARLVSCGERRGDPVDPAADGGAGRGPPFALLPPDHRHRHLRARSRASAWARAPCTSMPRSTCPNT